MKHSDVASGLFWLAFGIMLTIWAANYPLGSVTNPKPGFFPLLLGLLLILLSSILLLKPRKPLANVDHRPPKTPRRPTRRVVYSVAVFLLGTALFELAGYLITTFVIIVLLKLGIGPGHWRHALIMGFLVVIGVYVVFVVLLKQPLPYGIVGM